MLQIIRKNNADSISVNKPKHIIKVPSMNVYLLTIQVLDLPKNDVDGDVTTETPLSEKFSSGTKNPKHYI